MDVAALLIELYGRIPPLAERAVAGVPAATLAEAPGPGRNTIAWLVWHLARVQDSHIAELEPGTDQLWATGGWAGRMGLPPDPHDTGWSHTAAQVAAVRPPDGEVLLDYLGAVAARTETMLAGLTAADLDRVVDRRWDPPVTLGVRLVSVADDCLQHAGQAAYVRGLLGA
jgi:DinB superfamily